MTAADVLAAIGRGLAFGALWLLIAVAIALIIGRAVPRSDDDTQNLDSPAESAAEPDWVALSMQIGGASDFQHNDGGAR